MDKCYMINGWIFNKTDEDSSGGYFNVVDNKGIYAARGKKFSSVEEMKKFVESNGGCGSFTT